MFEDNENVYLIKKQPNESNKYYFIKCKFFSNIINKTKSLDYYLKMANIYANNKLYNCVYSESVMKELKSIIS